MGLTSGVNPQYITDSIRKQYTFENNTFKRVIKDENADRIHVEIGDSKQNDFYPQVKVMRWDNEVNFSVRLIDDSVDTPVVDTEDVKIRWNRIKKKSRFYELDSNESFPDGGYEFEVNIQEPPTSNITRFSIRSKGLEFFYQPELTPEEIEEGYIRPDNVVGSYAVYYKDVPRNTINGKLYRSGKAFHIYRPKIYDSAGNWCWGKLNIDEINQELTVEIPWEFLNNAVYPVFHTAGLTIGWTSTPASSGYSSQPSIISAIGTASATADCTKLFFYGASEGTTRSFQGGLYYGTSFQPDPTTSVDLTSASLSWVEADFTSPYLTLTNGNTYDISVFHNATAAPNRVYFGYDTGTVTNGHYKANSLTFPTWPTTIAWQGTTTNKYGVYALYGTTDYTLTATQQSYSLTGNSVALQKAWKMAVSVASFTLSMQTASFKRSRILSCTQQSFTVNGQNVLFRKTLGIGLAVGTFSLTGLAVGLNRGRLFSVTNGSISVIGNTTVLNKGYRLSAASQSYSVTGQSAGLTLLRNYKLTVSQGSYTLAGQSANFNLLRNYRLSTSTASFQVLGQSSNLVLLRNYRLTSSAMSIGVTMEPSAFKLAWRVPVTMRTYVITGNAVNLLRSTRVSAGVGSYTTSFQNATFKRLRNLLGSYALYSVNAQAALLKVLRNYTLSAAYRTYGVTYNPSSLAVQRNYRLTASLGSYSILGKDIILKVLRNYRLAVGLGSYVTTFEPSNFSIVRHPTIHVDSGIYTVNANGAGLIVTRALGVMCDVGAFNITGNNILLDWVPALHAQLGSYVVSGVSTGFKKGLNIHVSTSAYILSGPSVQFKINRAYVLTTSTKSLSLSFVNANLLSSRSIVAGLGSYVVTGKTIGLPRSYTLSAANAHYTVTYTTIHSRSSIASELGSYSVSGQNVGLTKSLHLTANSRSYSLTGNGVLFPITRHYSLSATTRSYSVVFESANFFFGRRMLSSYGSYTISGSNIGFKNDHILSASVRLISVSGTQTPFKRSFVANNGLYATTYQDVSFVRGKGFEAGLGSYTVTGSNVVFGVNISMAAGTGTYTVSGNGTIVGLSYSMPTSTGSLSLSGQDVSFSKGHGIIASTRTYTVSFKNTTLKKGLLSTLSTAYYTETGKDVFFLHGLGILAGKGSYAVTGATIMATKDLSMTASSGSYTISAQNILSKIGKKLFTTLATYALTGHNVSFPHVNLYQLKRWDGSSWVYCYIQWYNGTTFVRKPLYFYYNSAWQIVL